MSSQDHFCAFFKNSDSSKTTCQSDSVLGQTPAGLTAGTGLPHPLSLLEEGPARPAPSSCSRPGKASSAEQSMAALGEKAGAFHVLGNPCASGGGRGPVGPRAAGPPPWDAVGTPGLRGPDRAGCGQQLICKCSHNRIFELLGERHWDKHLQVGALGKQEENI